jgi:hypothetical protein
VPSLLPATHATNTSAVVARRSLLLSQNTWTFTLLLPWAAVVVVHEYWSAACNNSAAGSKQANDNKTNVDSTTKKLKLCSQRPNFLANYHKTP